MPTIDKLNRTIAQSLMKVVYDAVTTLPNVWQKLPEAVQEGYLVRIRAGVAEATKSAVREILAGGATYVGGHLKKIDATDNIKVTVLCAGDDNAIHALIRKRGSQVIIVLADSEAYTGGLEAFKSQADQPDLPLEPAVPALEHSLADDEVLPEEADSEDGED